MENILREIERTMEANLWYAAIALCLTIPDICCTLEAQPNARQDGQRARYQSWCRRNLPPHLGLSGDECWALRCGVVHEGRGTNRAMRHDHRAIAFTLPPQGTIHNVIVDVPTGPILSLSAELFCRGVIYAARNWLSANASNSLVRSNLNRLLQPRPNAFMPLVQGPTIIA